MMVHNLENCILDMEEILKKLMNQLKWNNIFCFKLKVKQAYMRLMTSSFHFSCHKQGTEGNRRERDLTG